MLSEKQIKQIAKEIVNDIDKFVREHQTQYDLFLKEVEKKNHDNKNKI